MKNYGDISLGKIKTLRYCLYIWVYFGIFKAIPTYIGHTVGDRWALFRFVTKYSYLAQKTVDQKLLIPTFLDFLNPMDSLRKGKRREIASPFSYCKSFYEEFWPSQYCNALGNLQNYYTATLTHEFS